MMFLIAYILVLVAHHTLHQLLEHKRRAAIGINIVLLLTILPSRLRHNKRVDTIIAHHVERMSLTYKHEIIMNDEAILLDRKLEQSPRGA
jgi:hypothetical protein